MLNGLKPLLVSKGQAICYFIILDKTRCYFIKNNKKFYTPCFIYYRQPSCLWVHDASFFMWYNTSMSVIYHSVVLAMQGFAHVLFFKYKKFMKSFFKYKKFMKSLFKYKKFMKSLFKYKKFMGLLKPVSLESLGGDTPLKLKRCL